MTDTQFKEVHYTLGNLISDIGLGRIGLGYDEFLTARRPLIARVIRAGYEQLPRGVT